MPNLFQQMCELAIANSLPRHHSNDLLVHDKLALEEGFGGPFLWLLYEHGTHIVWLDRKWLSEKNRGGAFPLVRTMISCFAHNPRDEGRVPASKWFYCAGCTCASNAEHCVCGGENLIPHLQAEIIERARQFDSEP